MGCGGKGGMFHRLSRRGLEDLYDSTWNGFRRWLKFLLKPKNASFLDTAYGATKLHTLIGFQTYRYLELAMLNPLPRLAACNSRDGIRAAYRENNIVNYTVHHENFESDLKTLLEEHLHHAFPNLEEVLKFLAEGHRLNASDSVDRFEEDPSLPERLKDEMKDREWLLHELFGY